MKRRSLSVKSVEEYKDDEVKFEINNETVVERKISQNKFRIACNFNSFKFISLLICINFD